VASTNAMADATKPDAITAAGNAVKPQPPLRPTTRASSSPTKTHCADSAAVTATTAPIVPTTSQPTPDTSPTTKPTSCADDTGLRGSALRKSRVTIPSTAAATDDDAPNALPPNRVNRTTRPDPNENADANVDRATLCS